MKDVDILAHGEKIRYRLNIAIQNKGLTQTQVAHALQVSPSTVSGWCNKGYIPAVTQIIDLAQLLEVSPAWLAGFTGAITGLADDNDKAVIEIIKALLK